MKKKNITIETPTAYRAQNNVTEDIKLLPPRRYVNTSCKLLQRRRRPFDMRQGATDGATVFQ